MAGWVLREDTGKIWKSSSLGDLNPVESKTIRRNGMTMNLIDGGDTGGAASRCVSGAKPESWRRLLSTNWTIPSPYLPARGFA